MQVPPTMTTPRMKLADGEEILSSTEGLRKKGILGNLAQIPFFIQLNNGPAEKWDLYEVGSWTWEQVSEGNDHNFLSFIGCL